MDLGSREDPNYSACMSPRSTEKISNLIALVFCGYVEGSMMTCKIASGFVFVGI